MKGSIRHSYCDVVLEAMPGTRREIEEKTGLSKTTVFRWVKELHACGWCFISTWRRPDRGPWMPRYSAGPGKDAACKLKYLTEAEKSLRFRKKARANGSWEDRLAQVRMRYWQRKAATRRDPIVSALFGPARRVVTSTGEGHDS